VLSFYSRRIDTEGRPPCPHCGKGDLQRRASAFAISKNRGEEKPGGEEAPSGFDEARLEQAMNALAAESGALEGDDPKAAARVMRTLFESAGLPVNEGMREALRRMESGEDPEKIEDEMGDVLGDEPFAGAPPEGENEPKGKARARARLRRLLPPSVDPTLYEM
jgi:hypothetical protein